MKTRNVLKILIAFFVVVSMVISTTAISGEVNIENNADFSKMPVSAISREEKQKAETSPAATNIIKLTREEWKYILAALEDFKEQDPTTCQVVEQALNDAVAIDENGAITLDMEAYELGIQSISENGELVNVTLYGYVKVWTWVTGPFGIPIPKKLPADANILVLLGGTTIWTENNTDDRGYYECSVRQFSMYQLRIKRYEGGELVGWKTRTILVLFKDKYAPFIFWDL